MELQTSRFGQLTVSEDEIYTFSNGIPGFEDQTSFVVVASEDDQPFAYLQSISDERLVFVIADPFFFYPDYDFELPESAVAELGVTSVDQVMIRSIISIGERLDTATINLVAPIVFNLGNQTAKQVVLGRTTYLTRHPLFEANKR
ncbi:flagellar assembly protein FliW [Paenibacillus solisilvae]|uniref:Flagellar assembly factor FliW n=1 Tax=Paenibacillus solisilvae TaxID=2486751 RepID=A0ABW0W4R9_9BACL